MLLMFVVDVVAVVLVVNYEWRGCWWCWWFSKDK